MLELGVDGVVVVSSWLAGAALRCAARSAPVVMVGRGDDDLAGVDTIANDDILGAGLAIEHLVALGHERIAHHAGSSRPAARLRREGYVATMHRLGLGAGVHGVGRGLRDGEGESVLAEVTRAGRTAVFSANDQRAVGLLDACWDRAVPVPGQLSVVGYDNTALAATVRPRLTTVDQPRQRMGALAVDLLVERFGGRIDDRHEILAPSLVVRETTTAPED